MLADTIAHRIHLDAPSKRVIASHCFPYLSPWMYVYKYKCKWSCLSHLPIIEAEVAAINIDETPDQKNSLIADTSVKFSTLERARHLYSTNRISYADQVGPLVEFKKSPETKSDVVAVTTVTLR